MDKKAARDVLVLCATLWVFGGGCGDSFTSSESASGGQAGGTGAAAGQSGSAGTGGDQDASAGSGGTGGAGGTAGSTGGTAGTGGIAGSAGAGAVAGGGGSGAVAGTGGSGATAGAAGASCPPFQGCAPRPDVPPPCDPCANEVCATLPYCCQSDWDAVCALRAQTVDECQCGGLLCDPASTGLPPDGSCIPSTAHCNPVQPGSQCPSQQCAIDADSGQIKFVCTAIGNLSACEDCNPSAGLHCGAKLSCVGGLCVRVCCTDEDCGSEAVCAPGLLPGSFDGIGICRRI